MKMCVVGGIVIVLKGERVAEWRVAKLAGGKYRLEWGICRYMMIVFFGRIGAHMILMWI